MATMLNSDKQYVEVHISYRQAISKQMAEISARLVELALTSVMSFSRSRHVDTASHSVHGFGGGHDRVAQGKTSQMCE